VQPALAIGPGSPYNPYRIYCRLITYHRNMIAANLITLFSRSRVKRTIFTALVGLAILSIHPSRAAGQALDETPQQPKSTLYLQVNSPGHVGINLYLLPPPPHGVNPLQEALKDSLGCDGVDVSSYDYGADGVHLDAECVGAIPRRGFMAKGDLNFSPLLREVRAQGVDALVLNISFHIEDVPFSSEGPAKYEASAHQKSFQRYRISANASPPPIIHIQIGYSPRDVARKFLPFLVLLVLPIVLTLYTRRAVLCKPEASRSGAWFGYWRFLYWNMLGTFLLWVAAVGGLEIHPFLNFMLSANAQGAILGAVGINAFYFLPPILVDILCRVLSHRIFMEVQGAEWTRREVFEQAVWSQLARGVPLAMLFTGISLIDISSMVWVALTLLGALFVWASSARRLQKVMNRELHALTTGELRDRAFALAEKAKVRLQQIYVMPTRKARMANASAHRGNIIMLTDYLLEHLSKREVDGVLAHELGHLKGHRRPIPILAAVIYAAFGGFAAANHEAIPHWLPESALIPLGVLFLILMGYLTSRRAERHADAAAVELTGDPEGLIRALVKLTALNRVPIHWGKLLGKLLTHPSTLQRAQTLARQGGIPEERLTQILNSPEEPVDHYPVPPTSALEGKVFSTTFRANWAFRHGWAFTAIYTFTPAFVAFIAIHVRLPVPLWCVLAVGVVATLLLTAWMGNVGPAGDGRTLKKRVLERLSSQGMAPDAWGGVFVGFSPYPFPRVYDGNYIWDVGFLIPAGDRLCYWGEETRFALRREQISQIRLGPGHPAWWPTHRLYIAWKDIEKGTSGTFNFVTADSVSIRKMYAETAALAERLQVWHRESSLPSGIPSELASLAPPALGEVTCLSPRQLVTARSYWWGSLYVALLAGLVAMLFGLFEAGGGWGVAYTMFVAIFTAIASLVPYTLYRDRPA